MQRMQNENLEPANYQRGLLHEEMGGEIKKKRVGIIRQGEDSKKRNKNTRK